MTDYIARTVSKFNCKLYYVAIDGKNRLTALEKLLKKYKGFNFFILTQAEYVRTMYEEEFVFEKLNEDGSLNEYQFVEWDHLPSNIKDYYRDEANKNVIDPIELKKIF